MRSALACCLVALFAGACGDDAVPADTSPPSDGGLTDTAPPRDSEVAPDGAGMDAGRDTGTDAATDSGAPRLPGTPVSDYGCVCDGTTNDSTCLQAALDDWGAWTNRTLEWPEGARCVAANLTWAAPDGDESMPYVLWGRGTTLQAPDGHPVPVGSPWGPILRINGGAWYVLDDLDFDGNRDTRTPRENPSHSLLVMSSRDVLIRDLDSVDAVTDGLYIASSDGGSLDSRPQRVVVENPIIRRAYRNNISVINCVDCVVRGDGRGAESSCQLTDAEGTPPQAGIDFEPNASNAAPAIERAVLDGCFIARNFGTGILLHTAGDSVGIVVRNNTVEGDRRTFRATCGAAMHMGFDDALIENNVFQNYDIDPACRAMFDWLANGSPQVTTFRRNRIENVRFDTSATHIFRIHPANGGSHSITDNTLVDIGRAAGAGGWCLDGASERPSEIRDNTVDGVLQSPNPGCP